jgi:hypothetical protein
MDHLRIHQCAGYGHKQIGADSQINGEDIASTGLAGLYAEDSNPTVAGLKVWMAGYGKANQPGIQCYKCYRLTVSAYFSQDNGGAAFSGTLADHVRLDVASDSDNGSATGQPAVSFSRLTNSRVDIVLSHRPGGLGIVSQGFAQDPASLDFSYWLGI